jgi:hypothetical protein
VIPRLHSGQTGWLDGLAPHKKLREGVRFVNEIPKAASGKILRRILRDQVQQESHQKRSRVYIRVKMRRAMISLYKANLPIQYLRHPLCLLQQLLNTKSLIATAKPLQ